MGRQTATRKLFSAFKRTVLVHGMIGPGDGILVACSGGPDSVALVELLLRLREEMSLDLSVAHFNHRLRPSARDDEAFVRKMCDLRRLPLTAGSRNVRLFARRRRLNLEEAGRELRYAFLTAAAGKSGATKIATGHTLNDQAETVLMRMMRGAGLKGLGGIAPVAEAGPALIIRPLIGMKREDVLDFLREEGISFREDETNLDRRFLRNRIRRDLIPSLEKTYEPRVVEHLARLAEIAREEDGLLDDFVRGLAREFVAGTGAGIRLDAKTLAVLSPGLARRVAREFLRELKGDLKAVSFHDVDALLRLREGKALPFGKGLVLRREKGEVRLRNIQERHPAAREVLWDGRGLLSREPAAWSFVGKKRKLRKGESAAARREDDRLRVVVDADKLDFPLLVRERRPGDRFRPLGAPGRKKLKEVLRAKGISSEERDRIPVFLSGGEIVWVPGLPVAERFKVDGDTQTVFIIEKSRRAGAPRPPG
jgi:tRNA(Ile)-lysidine synthase